MMKTQKKHSASELAESYVFPDVVSETEREDILQAFRNFRKIRSQEQTAESKFKNRLLQLKFLMEDYIASPKFEARYDFAYFLDQYISRLEINYTDFAKDIDVGLSTISQIIGKHRKPTDKIIFRIYIHSNKNFPVYLWYRLLEKERMFELENNRSIIENESKYVKHSLEFSLFE
jgi:hypothetical protein